MPILHLACVASPRTEHLKTFLRIRASPAQDRPTRVAAEAEVRILSAACIPDSSELLAAHMHGFRSNAACIYACHSAQTLLSDLPAEMHVGRCCARFHAAACWCCAAACSSASTTVPALSCCSMTTSRCALLSWQRCHQKWVCRQASRQMGLKGLLCATSTCCLACRPGLACGCATLQRECCAHDS